MISVILSTYNRVDRLRKAVQSVLKQTYQDFELIISDDHSTDDTQDYVESLDDVRIKYVRANKNYGSDTRPKNDGIKASEGKYIAFLDDDVTWRPDHLQALVRELEKHPEVAMVYGDRFVHDEDGQYPDGVGIFHDYAPMLLMNRNYIDTSDVLIRREAVLRVGGFDEAQKKYIDWNMWVRLCKCGYDFKRVPLILTDYTLHSGSKSKTKHTQAEEEYFKKSGQWQVIPDWSPIDCVIELPYLGAVREPRVAIFTLTMNRLEYTKACFAALKETAGYEFDHFVIDNGSIDGTVEWLYSGTELDGDCIGQFKENTGISKASNLAINMITNRHYDIIMKLDNDCLMLNKGWLAAMVKVWKSNHRLALSCFVQGLKDSPGGVAREVYGQIAGETLGMTRHLGGICHFVDAGAYDNWRWNENDFLHGVQDLEFSQYLNSHGYQMGYLENWFCEHIDGTEGQHQKYPEYFEQRKREKTTRYQS